MFPGSRISGWHLSVNIYYLRLSGEETEAYKDDCFCSLCTKNQINELKVKNIVYSYNGCQYLEN